MSTRENIRLIARTPFMNNSGFIGVIENVVDLDQI